MARTIGEIIKELRKQRKITQEELAELVGVTPQAISKWERDVGYPDITQIVPLSKAFGVSTDEILGVNFGDDEKQVEDYIFSSYKAIVTDGYERAIEILREAQSKFPHSYLVKVRLANTLISSNFKITALALTVGSSLSSFNVWKDSSAALLMLRGTLGFSIMCFKIADTSSKVSLVIIIPPYSSIFEKS